MPVGAVDGGDFRIGAEARAVAKGALDVLPDEAEAVHGGIGHAVHGNDVVREVGLQCAGLLHGDRRGLNAAFGAGGDPVRLEFGPVLGGADEETLGFLDAVFADAPEDAVFLDALASRVGVLHGVACAAVEEAVEARAGAVDEVTLFEQQRLDPAHGEVAESARARGSAADHDDVPVPSGIF